MKPLNSDQFWSFVRGLLKAGGGALVAAGVDQHSVKSWITGAVVAMVGFVLSHWDHADPAPPSTTGTVSGTITTAK